MNRSARLINESRKIVIKIGSNVLSDNDGKVNQQFVGNIVSQVLKLITQGKQVILVSSGAGICGVGAINKWSRLGDINYKQALCAIGQVELMLAYKEYFKEQNINVGQMLLSKEDFLDNSRNLNIRNTLFTLVDEGVVPIINENDSVSVDEIKIGDNDMLAAHTAALWNADLLVLLSDIDGIYDKSPKDNKDARLIEEVYDIRGLASSIDMNGKSKFGTGGIATKLKAAETLKKYNIPVVLLNGKKDEVLLKAQEGIESGTAFPVGD